MAKPGDCIIDTKSPFNSGSYGKGKMDTQLIVSTDPAHIIVPADAVKDAKRRLAEYAHWLGTNAHMGHAPDFAAYRDHLLAFEPDTRGMKPKRRRPPKRKDVDK